LRALRGHTLSADCTADHSRKENRRPGYGKKGKGSRPGFCPRSKGKRYAAWHNDQQDTAFWGKGKGKKGEEGMKGKDSFKGMPSRKGKKEKATERTREEIHFNNKDEEPP
jgi:hypothetical protein